MNKKIYNLIFGVIAIIGLFVPTYVFAVPPTEFSRVYEMRSDVSEPLKGYSGSLRAVGDSASTYGYYLGTTNQYLPYKVGTFHTGVMDYKGEGVTLYDASYALFCTEFGDNSPAINSYFNIQQDIFEKIKAGTESPTACQQTNNWSKEIQAGVGAIIKNVTNGQPVFSNTTLSKYYDGEIAINQFLYEKLGKTVNHQNSDGSNVITTYNKSLIDIANKAYEKAANKFSVAWPSNKQLTYSEDDKIWKSEHISVANIQYLDNYKSTNDYSTLYNVILKDSKDKVYEKYAYIANIGNDKFQVGVCDNNTTDFCKDISNYTKLPAGEYTVSVTIGQKNGKTYPIAKNYDCGTDYQDVTPAYTWEEKENTVASTTFSFTIEGEPEAKRGSITIKKVDIDTNEELSGAKVKIECVSSECAYTTTTKEIPNGSITVNDLPLGTYKITEVFPPIGYQRDDTEHTVTIKESELNGEITIKNKKLPVGKGSIKVIKVDSETKKEIAGAIIKLVCKDCEELFEISVDMTEGSKVFSELPYGTYEITEIEAPNGYVLSNETHTVTINEQKQNDEVTIENTLIPEKGTVFIKKIDSETKEYVVGAVMRIVDETGKEWDKWTTPNDTYVSVLPYGKYILEEVSAPEGYSKSDAKKQFEITKENPSIELEFVNDKIVEVPNTLSKLSIALIILGLIGLSSGSWLIYSNSKKQREI